MKIAIVITTHDRKRQLEELLNQINGQLSNLSSSAYFVEVVFDTIDIEYINYFKNKFSFIGVVYGSGNWWFTRSVNEGAKVAIQKSATHILVLNDDTILAEDYLTTILSCKMHLQNRRIVGSVVKDVHNKNQILFSGIKQINWAFFKYKHYNVGSDAQTNQSNNLLPTNALGARGTIIPVETLLEMNFFDEKYLQYASDYDFCFRAIQSGRDVLINPMWVVYDNLKSTGKSNAHIKKNIFDLLRSLFDKRSINFLPNLVRIIFRNAPYALPLALPIRVIAIFYTHFIKYKSIRQV